MPDSAPSLVEAAARAMCANAGIPDTDGTHWQQFTGGAEAVLAAVGDALRLEGAQAEHARAIAAIETLRQFHIDDHGDAECMTTREIAYGEVLKALGGGPQKASP